MPIAIAPSDIVESPGLFDGRPVADGDVVVRFTWPGDVNLNGNDDQADLSVITAATGTGWSGGDVNYDGSVDGADYSARADTTGNQYGFPAVAESGVETVGLSGDGRRRRQRDLHRHGGHGVDHAACPRARVSDCVGQFDHRQLDESLQRQHRHDCAAVE